MKILIVDDSRQVQSLEQLLTDHARRIAELEKRLPLSSDPTPTPPFHDLLSLICAIETKFECSFGQLGSTTVMDHSLWRYVTLAYRTPSRQHVPDLLQLLFEDLSEIATQFVVSKPHLAWRFHDRVQFRTLSVDATEMHELYTRVAIPHANWLSLTRREQPVAEGASIPVYFSESAT